MARVLNRIVRWHTRKRITYEADPRHAEIIIRDTGGENFKTISTPSAKKTGRETEDENRQDLNGRRLGSKLDSGDKDDALSAHEVIRYRRIAARANFLHKTEWITRALRRKQRS